MTRTGRMASSYKPRFFAYLSFFTFAMLMLVTADNLVQMFFGWEGVGVASYLLIGFYYRKAERQCRRDQGLRRQPGRRLRLRAGDLRALLSWSTRSASTTSSPPRPSSPRPRSRFLWTDWNAANLLAVLLFIGAMGKSAQLFLHTWLPDAMEGPTPVSALIHAATMVTAGVFLVCRMSPLFEYAPEAKTFIIVYRRLDGVLRGDRGPGAERHQARDRLFDLFAAWLHVRGRRRRASIGAAMFHLFTHAFFKAMLFLGAGSVIHAMHHEQDMRNYGGLRKKIP